MKLNLVYEIPYTLAQLPWGIAGQNGRPTNFLSWKKKNNFGIMTLYTLNENLKLFLGNKGEILC